MVFVDDRESISPNVSTVWQNIRLVKINNKTTTYPSIVISQSVMGSSPTGVMLHPRIVPPAFGTTSPCQESPAVDHNDDNSGSCPLPAVNKNADTWPVAAADRMQIRTDSFMMD